MAWMAVILKQLGVMVDPSMRSQGDAIDVSREISSRHKEVVLLL